MGPLIVLLNKWWSPQALSGFVVILKQKLRIKKKKKKKKAQNYLRIKYCTFINNFILIYVKKSLKTHHSVPDSYEFC
jgi:hypothetical protein